MDGVLKDLLYAIRGLRRRPALTVLAVLSLTLGIGVNTTMLGMVSSMLWNRLPVPDPEEIVRVFQVERGEFQRFSYANYRDLREFGAEVFEDLFVHRLEAVGLQARGSSEVVYGELVSAGYFDTLAIRPAVGRLFSFRDIDPHGGTATVVISDDLWQRRFLGETDVVGETIRLNDQPFEIVGVAESGFQGTKYGLGMDLWVPAPSWARVAGWGEGWDEVRDAHSWLAVARLSHDMGLDEAESGLSGAAAALRELAPEENRDLRLAVLSEIDGSIDPDAAGMPKLVGALAMGASILVLLVACANVASLLYARGLARSREIGIRYALGAGRVRLLRQLLSESVVLAVLGGTFGVFAAFWTSRSYLPFLPSLPYRFAIDTAPDLGVVAAAAGISLVAAVLAGLAPAWQASAASPSDAFVSREAVGVAGKRLRGLTGVVVAMVSLSFVSLALTGLFLRSLEKVRAVEPGFASTERVIAAFDTTLAGDEDLRPEAYARQVLERVRATAGVAEAAVSSLMPLGDRSSSLETWSDERVYDEDEGGLRTWRASVTPGFFSVMETPLLAGRVFDDLDRAGSARVAIVNQHLAQRLFPGESGVGRRLRFRRLPGGLQVEIVGVVENSRYNYLSEPVQPAIYFPFEQSPRSSAVLIARSTGPSGPLVPALERVIEDVDARVPILSTITVEQHVSGSLWLFRLGARFTAALGLLALGLSAVGLYGVMAHAVGQRRSELGIRAALGAEARDLMSIVLRQGARLTTIGVAIGLAAALGLSFGLKSLLFGVQPGDPMVLLGVAAALLLVSMLASFFPALSASRTDPARTLRNV